MVLRPEDRLEVILERIREIESEEEERWTAVVASLKGKATAGWDDPPALKFRRALAEKWREWIESDRGRRCAVPARSTVTRSRVMTTRLWLAFQAGAWLILPALKGRLRGGHA